MEDFSQGRSLYLPLVIPVDQNGTTVVDFIKATTNLYICQVQGNPEVEGVGPWMEFSGGVLVGKIGQVQDPLLLQNLKHVDNS